jgi:hypothetical protein
VHSHDPDETPCPVCGKAYDQRVVVERGDRWADVFGGPPFSALTKYSRRCASRHDVEEERARGEGERVVYFHDDGPAGRR